MSRWVLLGVLLLPGGSLLWGACLLARCRHPHTIWRRRCDCGHPASAHAGEHGPCGECACPGRAMGTECLSCGKWRRAVVLEPVGVVPPKLSAPALPRLFESDPLAELERLARRDRAAAAVRARYGGPCR